jgi:hypothetical protein
VAHWTAQRVLDAAADWVWVPDGAVDVCTDDYQLIRYPHRVLETGFPAAQVVASATARPLGEVIGEVTGRVRSWELPSVDWWITSATRPADTEAVLLARGAELTETMNVLGCPLGDDTAPQPDPPADVLVEVVHDERTLHAASSIAVTGWGRPEPDQAELARQLGQVQHYLSTGSEFQVVAYLAGKPVSAAGCTLRGEVAQLWGGITLPGARRRGAYRAALAERLRLAREHGASLALVKAKPDTSAPILLRAGFTEYGQQRRYRLATG